VVTNRPAQTGNVNRRTKTSGRNPEGVHCFVDKCQPAQAGVPACAGRRPGNGLSESRDLHSDSHESFFAPLGQHMTNVNLS
jgi:hypothetical protein